MSSSILRAVPLLLCSLSLPGCAGSGDPSDPSTAELCGESSPLTDADAQPSGIQACEDGSFHRATTRACQLPEDLPACSPDAVYVNCSGDSDCTDGPNGRCWGHVLEETGELACGCMYPCETDADCHENEACLCPGDVGDQPEYPSCVWAGCRTDADCPSGGSGSLSDHDARGITLRRSGLSVSSIACSQRSLS